MGLYYGCECAYVCVCVFLFLVILCPCILYTQGHIFHGEQVPQNCNRYTLFFHFYLWLSCDSINLFFILTFEGIFLSSFTHSNVFRNAFDFPWMVTTAVKQYFQFKMFLSYFIWSLTAPVPIHFHYSIWKIAVVTPFKTFPFVFLRIKTKFCNNMWLSKYWQNFQFCVNYPFNLN